jgi:hypothetical protein
MMPKRRKERAARLGTVAVRESVQLRPKHSSAPRSSLPSAQIAFSQAALRPPADTWILGGCPRLAPAPVQRGARPCLLERLPDSLRGHFCAPQSRSARLQSGLLTGRRRACIPRDRPDRNAPRLSARQHAAAALQLPCATGKAPVAEARTGRTARAGTFRHPAAHRRGSYSFQGPGWRRTFTSCGRARWPSSSSWQRARSAATPRGCGAARTPASACVARAAMDLVAVGALGCRACAIGALGERDVAPSPKQSGHDTGPFSVPISPSPRQVAQAPLCQFASCRASSSPRGGGGAGGGAKKHGFHALAPPARSLTEAVVAPEIPSSSCRKASAPSPGSTRSPRSGRCWRSRWPPS